MAEEDRKRKAPDADDQANKKAKGNSNWHGKKGKSGKPEDRWVKAGESGFWVTCHKGKERKCMGEMRDLLAEYTNEDGADDAVESGDVDDIEKDISSEIADIKKPSKESPVTAVWTDIQCVVFIRTAPSINPTSLVERIMRDAANEPARKRTRCTQRLTPASVLGHADEEGLDQVARQVLAPYFHDEPVVAKKFAIRPTFRNHSTLKRDAVIKQVASVVGRNHSVDLKNPDLTILVDVVKNICSVAVVGPEYEQLKRFNLQEIFEPNMRNDA